MSKYIIANGDKPAALKGKVKVQGSKNGALPLIAAAALTDREVVLNNCPDILDVENMLRIYASLGGNYVRRGHEVRLKMEYMNSHEIASSLAGELRSSVFMLGAILSRAKKAAVAYPGGCDIGLRPIDLHLKAFREMGVRIRDRYGYIQCDASNTSAAEIDLDYPSVGATENIMMLAAGAKGTTTIKNAAGEPEIIALQEFINALGGSVSGAGSSVVRVEGTEDFGSATVDVDFDRIVAGTYMIAVAMCGGEVIFEGVDGGQLTALISKLKAAGAEIDAGQKAIKIASDGLPRAVGSVETGAYPGFPTDLQAPFGALAAVSSGSTVIVENIFETRFKYLAELTKMGASVKVKDRVAVLTGTGRLTGASVKAMDLRGGAALMLAGLKAEGVTVIENGRHIMRGYEAPEEVLSALGASVTKV